MLIVALAIVGIQAVVILALLVLRARGRAEASARQARLDAVAGLASSLFHDIRQPLNAILMNANASLRWLDRPQPDVPEIRAAITDVVDAGQRVDQIMRRHRELIDEHTQESR